jgi:YrbI family 3-deoxy-D-manno-octulosonate 8-phosphate phosphatase
MTDGGVIINDRGEHTLRFHIHDGLGVRMWRSTGKKFGILTGRNVEAVRIRSENLSADVLYQGADEKLATLEEFRATHQVAADQVCFIGDDLLDVPVLRRVGLAIAVANAPMYVQDAAHYTTSKCGGDGAVREAVEFVLQASGDWESVLNTFDR